MAALRLQLQAALLSDDEDHVRLALAQATELVSANTALENDGIDELFLRLRAHLDRLRTFGSMEQAEAAEREAAALLIQSVARGLLQRNAYERRRHELKVWATTRMQANWRGRRGRQRTNAIHESLFETLERMATEPSPAIILAFCERQDELMGGLPDFVACRERAQVKNTQRYLLLICK